MKIISLNIWGGRLYQAIETFIRSHAADTDVFCFQEMHAHDSNEANKSNGERPNLLDEIQGMLPGFTGYFAEQVTGTGLAMIVRKSIDVEKVESSFVISEEDVSHLHMSNGSRYYPRIVQSIKLKTPSITIYNFHGIPGSEKKDTPERELQMRRLHEFLDKSDGEKVLVGDFNLRPDTQAIRGLEVNMRNLVMEGGFKTTRTPQYPYHTIMPFADYTFVTSGIKINHFEVMSDEVSDHSPMCLEID